MRGLIIMSNRLDFNQLSGYTVRKDLSGQWPDFKSTDFSWMVWKQFSSAPVEGRQTNVDHRFSMSNVSVMAQASGNKLISDVTSKRIAMRWWAILVTGLSQQQHSRRNATRRAAVGHYSVQKCTCGQKSLRALGARGRRLAGAWLQLGGRWTPLAGFLRGAGARSVCLSQRAETGPLRAKAPQFPLAWDAGESSELGPVALLRRSQADRPGELSEKGAAGGGSAGDGCSRPRRWPGPQRDLPRVAGRQQAGLGPSSSTAAEFLLSRSVWYPEGSAAWEAFVCPKPLGHSAPGPPQASQPFLEVFCMEWALSKMSICLCPGCFKAAARLTVAFHHAFRNHRKWADSTGGKTWPPSGFKEQQCSKTEASTSEMLRWRAPAQLCAKAHTRARNPKRHRINTVLIAIWKHNKGIPEQSHYMLILGISVRFSHQVCGRTVFFSSFW